MGYTQKANKLQLLPQENFQNCRSNNTGQTMGTTWVALWMVLMAMGPRAFAILNPPYFNLAEGRRITATATCGVGVSGPELYCKLVGAHADQKDNPNVNLIQGQVCDFCDPSDPNLSHTAEYAIDGTEKWWQSPPLSRGNKYNEINVTIDLGQEFHVAYVFIKMANSPRPGVWVLERSTDLGETWEAWQYFADTPSDCVNFFGQKSLEPLTQDDSVICETKFSRVVPLEGGEIVVSLLNDRPSANNFYNSTILQEWTKATNIRLRLIRTKTLLGHLMSVARQDPTVTRRYFYSIRDINVGGRCVCNGHADLCDITDPNDVYKLLCRCQHNTCGAQCEICCPGYVQKKWRRATTTNLNECEPCNCFGHSNQCEYDAEVDLQQKSLDIHGRYVGGGVCQNCQHNTEGVNCNRCKPGYYRPYGKPLNATDVCYPCQCQLFFSTGSCAEETGLCECRAEFLPPYCDKCNVGYFGYPSCRPCDCNVNGTRGSVCEVAGGQCPCKPNYSGKNCDICAPDYYGFPDCQSCNCNAIGSVGTSCDLSSGQCECRNNYGGRTCSECDSGYYDYPSCKYCNCDLTGTLTAICDKLTGTCLCQEGYSGLRCDQCAPGFYGYPQCRVCQCNDLGSTSNICDETGKCRCLINFSGKNCDQCSPGYYRYPECLPCNCDSAGSIGLSCDDDGRCQCRHNFDGVNCKVCKQGYYNYPSCEECNCNPAGVLSTFAGCDSQSSGDLCQCKERVTGRICNHCRPLYWNLQPSNPLGCEDCNCHFPGTLGGIGMCEEVTGQCFCKTNVRSTKCKECRDGTYDLQETNLFGCIDCGCNVGGAVGKSCDKESGQCICRPRIQGRTCSEPLQLHYFPTLFQYLYELEDGRTPSHTAVRFGYQQDDFPAYSWRGYGVFSQIQKEILLDIYIDKPSLYRVATRYANPGSEVIIGSVTFTPDSSADIQQTGTVHYEPTSEPRTVTVVDKESSVPFPFVLNPGRWTVTIDGERPLLMDYIVLLPSAYYEGTILQERVETPCILGGTTGKCRHYKYPELSQFPSVRGEAGYLADGDSRIPTQMFEDQQVLEELGTDKMAMLDDSQREIFFELFVPKPGRYVLVILYHTPRDGQTANVHVEALSSGTREKGRSILYHCPFSALCRQTVIDMKGKVVVFNLDSNYVTLHFKAVEESDLLLAIDSVVAIPNRQSHMDIIRPESSCIRSDGKCLAGGFQVVPDTVKVEAEEGNEKAADMPADIFDANVGLVYLDHKDAMVDIKGNVSHPGNYKFVIHYYQTQHAEFDLDVLIQNGQFYEGAVPVPFCPTISGCRAVIKSKDGSTDFQILQNFIVTLKEPNHKSVWIDYILAIPSDRYHEDVLQPLPLDKSAEFITQCGQNHFYLDTDTQGFCRDAVFSLTAEYNNGGLRCDCNVDGSLSLECDQFGGQCPCKSNVIGRTCTECRTGYYAFPECNPCKCPSTAVCHPTTGACICPPRVSGDKCNRCLPNTYGFDPIIGCEECNCDVHGVVRGNLQCDLQTGECDCKDNVVGRQCNLCRAGYWSFPFCQLCNCDLRGTKKEICDADTSVCFCKENVYGAECSECTPGTFNLEEKNPAGCTKCFCFGRSERCSSSYLFWYQMSELEGWRAAALLIGATSVHEYPSTEELTVNDGQIVTDIPYDLPLGSYYYFMAPDEYLGNKVTSYGGKITYIVEYANTERDTDAPVLTPEVILMGNNLTLVYEHGEQAVEKVPLQIEMELREWNFRHVSRAAVTREQLMQVLAYLDKLYVKATYHTSSAESRLSRVTLQIAAPRSFDTSTVQAISVEQCQCPPNYQGSSCEDCSVGYYRSQTGPFGGFCIPCNCNNHAESCDPVTGACINCRHNTMGTYCEKCVEGFHGDATLGSPNDCLICACPEPIQSNNFATSCELSPSGLDIRCVCKEGYIGARCDYCAAGFYGRPEVIGDYCKPCRCNENIDTNSIESCDSVTGACLQCLNNTHGAACEICKPGFYGDAITAKNCRQCYCDDCGMRECHHSSGTCICNPNVEGESCDRCRLGYWGFDSCEGCIPCDCSHGAQSQQCDVETGQCECKHGVAARTCDRCLPGFWNLGPDGCKECKCKQDYSIGGTCNPNTGRCECLPGVVGDRCDSCPHRWVLVGNVGCQECGPCVHVLLDDLDALHFAYDIVWKEIQGIAVIQFAYTRLARVNKTVDELWPKVNSLIFDSTSVDLHPLELKLEAVEQQSIQLEGKAERTKDHSNETMHEADKTRQDALEVEKQILDTIKEVQAIVAEILRLVLGLVDGAGANIDRMIAEAEKMLAEIKGRDFLPPKSKADAELKEALDLLERAKAFALPSKQNKERLVDLQNGLGDLQAKLRELLNISADALNTTKAADQLNTKNRKPGAIEKVQRINALKDGIETVLAEARELLAQAKQFLEDARNAFEQLKLDVEKLKQLTDRLRDYTKELEDGLNDVSLEVRKAQHHAERLMQQAKELDNLLADTREIAKNAVRAVNSYTDIVNAINEALEAATQAVGAANNATLVSDGLDDDARASLELSRRLLAEAKRAKAKVEEDLAKRLEEAKAGVEVVAKMNQVTQLGLDELNRAMDLLPALSVSQQAEDAKRVAADANEKATDALDRIQGIVDKLPDDKRRADQIPKDIEDANQAIKRANNQVNTVVGLVPDITNLMIRLEIKDSAIRVIGVDVGEKIAELKRKIALARDQANRIAVGMQFAENTTVQLHNPEGLQDTATATQLSLYFKTNKPDGLLVYLGNGIGTHERMKRTRTDDYMALEVNDGNVNVKMNLGSGYKQIVNSKRVDDNQWRQVLLERTGRIVTLQVKTQDEEATISEDTLPGYYAVFNLDQQLSKFYVGGIPNDTAVQDEVGPKNFVGSIEEIVFDEKPVGLWNFKSGKNNVNGTIARDKLLSDAPQIYYQFGGNGYVILPRRRQHNFATKVDVILRFKTYAENGLLFLIGDKGEFFALEIKDGNVLLQFDLGAGATVVPTKTVCNDGNWHTVEAYRSGREYKLRFDGEDVAQGAAQYGNGLQYTNEIFIGGYPKEHNFRGVTNVDFEGCMSSVQIGSSVVELKDHKEAFGIIPGCPTKVSRSVTFSEDSRGHIGMPNLELDDEPTLTFRFKTEQANSLLFYTASNDQSQYLSVSLAEGILVLRSHPGGFLQSVGDVRYNDAEWHYVSVTKDSKLVRMVVDDYDDMSVAATSSGPIKNTAPMYFGGVPRSYTIALGAAASVEPFVGCISDATIQGKFQNFADTRDRVGAMLVSCHVNAPVTTPQPPPEVTTAIVQVVEVVTTTSPPVTTVSTRPPRTRGTPSYITTSTAPPPTTPSTQCQLPLRPAVDGQTTEGTRYGNTHHSHEEHTVSTNRLKSNSNIALSFKTSAKNGVLFYISGNDNIDFMAAYMKDGKVIFAFNLGSGPLDVTSPGTYSDDRWHLVEVTRQSIIGRLKIDGVLIGNVTVTGSTRTMDVSPPLNIGGLPKSEHPGRKEAKSNLQQVGSSFNGCIRDVRFFGQVLAKPTRSEAVAPCSKNVEPGAFFSANGGHVVLFDQFQVGLNTSIKFEFRPRNLSGVLMAVHGRRGDFLAIQMIDGAVKFSVDNGIGIISTVYTPRTNFYLCDGKWHRIDAIKSKNFITLSVDGMVSEPGIGVPGVSSTDTNDPLYVGGMPKSGNFKGIDSNAQYVGCIRNIVIKKVEHSFANAAIVGDVTINTCPTI